MKTLLFAFAAAAYGTEFVAMPGQSPLIQFRIVFRAGAANDPAGKEGLAELTASMLASGGTKTTIWTLTTDCCGTRF
jgi:zinc protease